MPLEQELLVLYLAIYGYLDDMPVEKAIVLEENFHKFMETNHPEIGGKIAAEKELSSETTASASPTRSRAPWTRLRKRPFPGRVR